AIVRKTAVFSRYGTRFTTSPSLANVSADARTRRSADSASRSTSVSPFTMAVNIARPETPLTSEASFRAAGLLI
ncbi:MAG: hypothetical protein M0Z41_00830, partial [Peptococcaceae bacterium]|nr:hypothetical protein [Peptococcaceae bacterium]